MTHVLVVGGGIAGLTAALHADAAGCTVTVATKTTLADANTTFAQGGIAAVMNTADRIDDHVDDTITAGSGVNDPAAVRVLAAEGADRIRELVTCGVAFDRDSDGGFAAGLEAAHSFPRILHAGGDATGRVIEEALISQVRGRGIRILEQAFLTDLVRDGTGAVIGAQLLIHNAVTTLRADAVVLATGGAGRLYAHTTNPAVATGDGIAAALRAGAATSDLEFVQFHPTVLAGPSPFLVSEAVRGEGAHIIDDAGRRFLFDAHPDGELAPRDVVARAIARRMAAQGGRPARLDATAVHSADRGERAAFLARRFPTIDAAVRAAGFDWACEAIPVTPAAHYLMGGITTDLHGRTSLPGLYAVGECARTGVHGANRLASNSLLEGAVFGARAGDAVARDTDAGLFSQPTAAAPAPAAPRPAPAPVSAPTAPTLVPAPVSALHTTPFDRGALQRLMWEHVGLERDAAGLALAASVLAEWAAAASPARAVPEWEDRNLLAVAGEVVAAARARTASAGAHFRTDAPMVRVPAFPVPVPVPVPVPEEILC